VHREVCDQAGMSDRAPPAETRTNTAATVAATAAHDLAVLRPPPGRAPVSTSTEFATDPVIYSELHVSCGSLILLQRDTGSDAPKSPHWPV
jgi:hypothetical protein